MATFNITSLSHCWDVVWNTLFTHLFLWRWSNRHPSPWGRKLKLAMMLLFRALVFGSSENAIFSRKKLHETWNCEKLWKTQSCEKFTFPIVAGPSVCSSTKVRAGAEGSHVFSSWVWKLGRYISVYWSILCCWWKASCTTFECINPAG